MTDTPLNTFSIDEARKTSTHITWLSLEVIRTDQNSDTHGLVEFKSSYMVQGKIQHLHEISYFKRLDNRWVYYHGEIQST